MSKTDQVHNTLKASKNIAVVGVSDKPDRPSFQIAQYLLENTPYKLYFVNPRIESCLGQKVYASLSDIPEQIDMVDVFRKSEDIPPVMEEAIKIGAKVFWMQLGIENEAAALVGEAAGLEVIQNKCIKIEYENLIGA